MATPVSAWHAAAALATGGTSCKAGSERLRDGGCRLHRYHRRDRVATLVARAPVEERISVVVAIITITLAVVIGVFACWPSRWERRRGK
jgi:hypothetical protein